MRVLITGGAGFVGSHLVDKLIKEGNGVVVIDNLSSGKKENLNQKAKFYKIDIRNDKVSLIFKKEQPQAVFHYAAQISVKKSLDNPVNDAEINILGALNILENCRRNKVRKFIFASSVGVYGEPENLPIKEGHALNPISPYSITKMTIEKYLGYYGSKLNTVFLRYANIYGPRQLGSSEGGVVAIFINKILKKERPIIFGDGNQTRDLLYVEDAVEAAVKVLKHSPSNFYNIGTEKEISIKNLLKLISLKMRVEYNPVFKSFRSGEIIKSKVCYSRASKETKWAPKFPIENGIEETIEWFKNNH
jgi:UDP-glucose 4-epimerase